MERNEGVTQWRHWRICLLVILLAYVPTAYSAFYAEPKHISPTETNELTLKCEPDASITNSILAVQIKKVLYNSPTQVPKRAKRAVGSTFYRATLTSGNSIGIVPDIDRFKGLGKINHPAYLTVMMAKPDADDAGSYECDVTQMGSSGVEVKKETLTVTSATVMNLAGLDRRVETLEHQIPAMSAIGQSMQRIVEEDRGKNKALMTDVESLKQENKDLVQSVEELMKKFKILSDRTVALMEEHKLEMVQLKNALAEQKQKLDEHQQQQQREQQHSKQEEQQKQQQQQQQQQQQYQQQQPQQQQLLQQQQQQPYRQQQQLQQQQQQYGQQTHQAPNYKALGSSNSRVGLAGTSTENIVDSISTGNAGPNNGQPNLMNGQYGNYRPNNNNNNNNNNNGYVNNGYNRNGYANPFNNYNNNGYNNYYGQANPFGNQYQGNQGMPYNNNNNNNNNNGRGYQYQNNNGAPQYGNNPFNNNINNNNNNIGGQMPTVYGNNNGYQGNVPQQMPPHLKSDDLFRIKSRMDDIENIRLAAVERQIAEIQQKWLGPMKGHLDQIDLYVNGTLVPQLAHCVDQADFDDMQSRMVHVEDDVMPRVINNVAELKKHLVIIHRAIDLVKGRENATDDEIVKALKEAVSNSQDSTTENDDMSIVKTTRSQSTSGSQEEKEEEDEDEGKEEEKEKDENEIEEEEPPDTTTTSSTLADTKVATAGDGEKNNAATADSSKGSSDSDGDDEIDTLTPKITTTLPAPNSMRCYTCGNNDTHESCTRHTNDDEAGCPKGYEYCMTGVFQDGLSRDVYKRCATKNDCTSVSKSDPLCATTTFMTLTPISCYYCCVSNLCNNSLRPTKDLYVYHGK